MRKAARFGLVGSFPAGFTPVVYWPLHYSEFQVVASNSKSHSSSLPSALLLAWLDLDAGSNCLTNPAA